MNTNSIHRFFLYAAIGTLALSMAVTACKRKNNETDPDPDLTTERDISNGDNDLNSLMGDIDKAFDAGNGSSLRAEGGYATWTWSNIVDTTVSGNTYNKKLVVTYAGTTGDDGQLRSGAATVYFAGTRPTETFGCYAIFTGSKVGGRSITGTQTVKQEMDGNANTWTFDIDASGTITTIDGRKIAYTSSRKRTRTGISTLGNNADDSFSILGSWTGTNANGESVTANIVTPLQLSHDCHYFREITAGKIDFINNSKGITRSIDYGTGSCDGKGTYINVKGRAFTFSFYR